MNGGCSSGAKPNISRTSLQNCRSLGFARDDKGEGGASMEHRCLVKRTAGLSTSLHFGRDDNSYFGRGVSAQEKLASGITSAAEGELLQEGLFRPALFMFALMQNNRMP